MTSSRIQTVALLSCAVLLFFTIVSFTFSSVNLSPLLDQLSVAEVLKNIGLGIAFFFSFGLTMRIGLMRQYKLPLQPVDMITLPIMMHLFTYIIPVKGGLLFQIFFIRYKYKLKLSKTFSLGIMTFAISVFLTVVIGLGLSLYLQSTPDNLLLIFGAIGLGLIFFPVALWLLPNQPGHIDGLVLKILRFGIALKQELASQARNRRLVLDLIWTTLISIFIQSLWFWQSADMLGISADFYLVVLIVLILRIMLLVRLLPGNLGIQELIIGGVFLIAGFSVEEGLTVALLTRLVSVFLATTIGLVGLYSNLHYFDSTKISAVTEAVATIED